MLYFILKHFSFGLQRYIKTFNPQEKKLRLFFQNLLDVLWNKGFEGFLFFLKKLSMRRIKIGKGWDWCVVEGINKSVVWGVFVLICENYFRIWFC